MLRHAQDAGEITATESVDVLAHYLVTVIQGLREARELRGLA